MQYVEFYAGDEGVSHFRDVAVESTPGESVPPALPIEFSPFRAATGVGDGEIRQFTQGSIWLHRDRNGRGHHTRVISDEAAKLVMVMFPDE